MSFPDIPTPVLRPLSGNEQAPRGATHAFLLRHEHLTETTANTAQTFTFSVQAGDAVKVVDYNLRTTFEDESDSAFNSTTAIIGDGNDTDRFLRSSELNANGSEVLHGLGLRPTVLTGTDDDSATSNGTDVNVVQAGGGLLHLESTTANDGDTYVELSNGEKLVIIDSDSPGGVALAIDEDYANADERLQANFGSGVGGYLVTDQGSLLKVRHASSGGVATHVDDDGATASARLLFVSPTNADASIQTDNNASLRNLDGGGAYLYTAADTVDVTINAMSGKALNDIDKGEIVFYFNIQRLDNA